MILRGRLGRAVRHRIDFDQSPLAPGGGSRQPRGVLGRVGLVSLWDGMRWLGGAVLVVAVAYVVLCGALYALQRRIVFVSAGSRPDPVASGAGDVEVLEVRTADGLGLNAWFAPPPPDGRVALFLHGNAGTIGHRAGRIAPFRAAGWGVLLLDWRGYGGNPGDPSEEGLARDARAAYDLLRARGVAAERIVIWGESLGTALAVRLGGEVASAAVVLEAPFTSMIDMAHRQYPFVPAERLLKDRFESLARMPRVTAPVLVLHGSDDRLIPPDMGRALAAAAPDGRFVLVEGAGHNDLGEFGVVPAGIDFVTGKAGR